MESFADSGTVQECRRSSDGAGETRSVQAAFYVGADGSAQHGAPAGSGSSGRRHWNQRQFMGRHDVRRVPARTGLAVGAETSKAWMYVSRQSPAARVHGFGGRVSEYAFHAALRPGEDARHWTEDDARRIFAEAAGLELPIEILSMGTWLAGHALVAQRFRQGRVFIAGDAAHLFTPAGGLGYNTAVEDAVNLGWKLAAALRGQAGPALLDSYEVERKRLAERNTAYARHFADSVGLFGARPELEEDSRRGEAERRRAAEHFDKHARLEFDIPGVTFGGRYDGSPVIAGDGSAPPPDEPNAYMASASPGGRPPHAWLGDGRSLFDLFHSEWTLLTLGPDAPATAAFEAAAHALALDLRIVRLPQRRCAPCPSRRWRSPADQSSRGAAGRRTRSGGCARHRRERLAGSERWHVPPRGDRRTRPGAAVAIRPPYTIGGRLGTSGCRSRRRRAPEPGAGALEPQRPPSVPNGRFARRWRTRRDG